MSRSLKIVAISLFLIFFAASACSSAIRAMARLPRSFRNRPRDRETEGARSWGLRAAFVLAKLYQSTGRPADAHAVLVLAFEGFALSPEMPEIAQVQALVSELAEDASGGKGFWCWNGMAASTWGFGAEGSEPMGIAVRS